ncbi:hypothetical protein [Micromonospora mirobrigensis]|uniref:Uncharacterized protein n=1 Tax=Micromonospora mirobrigensis TaxID=262898 RepID=A0A1C4X4J7_9ACTN|nr:hypothetical protein [Micromonospora mirobrigensis]SCF03330.1 hypothetical protein GA0070564_102707 [Micromonospora mirobrigensis]
MPVHRSLFLHSGPRRRPHDVLRAMLDQGIELFGGPGSTRDPDRCPFEVTVGGNVLDPAPQEVVAALRDLLERAR